MDYEYEYEDDEPYGRVLWGRIALLLVALVLVFLLGRCTAAGGDGSEVAELEAEIAAYQDEISQLQEELEAVQAGGAEDERLPTEEEEEEDDADDEDAEPDDEDEDEAEDEVRTHEVSQGETLHGIAEEYYGDPREAERIIEANNLSADDPLTVGQVLEIPPDD